MRQIMWDYLSLDQLIAYFDIWASNILNVKSPTFYYSIKFGVNLVPVLDNMKSLSYCYLTSCVVTTAGEDSSAADDETTIRQTGLPSEHVWRLELQFTIFIVKHTDLCTQEIIDSF